MPITANDVVSSGTDIASTASGVLGVAAPILGIGEGAFQLFNSIGKEKKDKAELDALKQPFYKIQDEFYQNRNIASGLASQGLAPDQLNYLTTESERGLGTSLGSISEAGGDANSYAALLGTYTDSIRKNAALDADTHIKNIDYFMNANKDLAGQKITKQSLDELQPYERKLKELTERKSADETSAYNGANLGIQSLDALSTATSNDDLKRPKQKQADPFSYESDYQQWKKQLELESQPNVQAQPTSGKFAEGNEKKSTDYINELMKSDPAAFLKLLDPSSPLFKLSNQPI
jgi:hypothetical protein